MSARRRKAPQFYGKGRKDGVDIKEFDSDEEDSQEDTSNPIVTNYDDWLDGKPTAPINQQKHSS